MKIGIKAEGVWPGQRERILDRLERVNLAIQISFFGCGLREL